MGMHNKRRWSHDSIVGIVSGLRLDGLGFESDQKLDLSLLLNVQTASGVHAAL